MSATVKAIWLRRPRCQWLSGPRAAGPGADRGRQRAVRCGLALLIARLIRGRGWPSGVCAVLSPAAARPLLPSFNRAQFYSPLNPASFYSKPQTLIFNRVFPSGHLMNPCLLYKATHPSTRNANFKFKT